MTKLDRVKDEYAITKRMLGDMNLFGKIFFAPLLIVMVSFWLLLDLLFMKGES